MLSQAYQEGGRPELPAAGTAEPLLEHPRNQGWSSEVTKPWTVAVDAIFEAILFAVYHSLSCHSQLRSLRSRFLQSGIGRLTLSEHSFRPWVQTSQDVVRILLYLGGS